MIQLFGQLTLIFAMLFAMMQSTLPVWGFFRNNQYASAFARPSALGQFVCIFIAYLLLTIAFGTNDFSIAYVANNSHATLPLLYRLTAVWGAHEGSILLWILLLNVWCIVFSIVQRNNSSLPLVLAVFGTISFCFLCFLLLTSNPFLPAQELSSGHDLNPLLQDPGFIIHPPMLYTGYVGFSAAFAITQAALLRGQFDALWARTTRQFAIAAWCFLTLGIALGSWWAYRVLGWGGFWFWDPVENASLLPWLAGTALIHVLILVEKRDTVKNWAVLLSIVTFALSLLGTFLVRSGVLISAHTFASDPARGVFLLLLLAILATTALIIYVWRLPKLIDHQQTVFSWLSREMSLLLNSALLFVAMTTILLGTLYPLIVDALHLGTVSVGAPYFNLVMAPIVFVIMFFMGYGPLCQWQQQSLSTLWKSTWKKLLGSIVISLLLLWFFVGSINITALFSLSLSFWIISSVVRTYRYIPGASIAHFGFAITVIGIMLSSLLSLERDVKIKPEDMVQVGPYAFTFVEAQEINGANFRSIRTTFEVGKNNRHVTNLYPEKRIYLVRNMVMTTVDINASIFRDLYIALGEPLEKDYWSVRIYYKPFVRWIWFGGLLMILGGIITLIQYRKPTASGKAI